MQHFESVALRICTDVSARHGLPALTFIYEGFLQLHVEGNGEGTSQAVKRDAEAALPQWGGCCLNSRWHTREWRIQSSAASNATT